VAYNFSVNYDREFPQYKTKGGMNIGKGGLVTSPTIMWVKAFDLVLTNMKKQGFPFSSVRSVSGSGQQHGSVYWKKGSGKLLANLKDSETLAK
jgi:xylulokinase